MINAGIAKITFYQRTTTARSAKVSMIVIDLLGGRDGLPAGTTITVATATGRVIT